MYVALACNCLLHTTICSNIVFTLKMESLSKDTIWPKCDLEKLWILYSLISMRLIYQFYTLQHLLTKWFLWWNCSEIVTKTILRANAANLCKSAEILNNFITETIKKPILWANAAKYRIDRSVSWILSCTKSMF